MDAVFALGLVFILFGVVVTLAGLVFWIWSIVDSLRFSDAEWQAAGQNRLLWVLGNVVVGLFGFGWVSALVYLLWPRPALKRARLTQRPVAPYVR